MTKAIRIEVEFEGGAIRRIRGREADRWLKAASDLSLENDLRLRRSNWEVGWVETRTDQARVVEWMRTTFTEAENEDAPERTLRLAEEALELAQAVGVDAETCHRLVDYVFNRPAGKPAQEIAGVMVTLYAAASALGVDADAEFEKELERIQTPEVIERCRRRQHEKRAATNAPKLGVRVGMVFKDKASIGDAGRRLQVLRVEELPGREPRAVCLVSGINNAAPTHILCRRLLSDEFVWVESLGAG